MMLSRIRYFSFCRRQWALIHIEQQWAENEHIVTGELMHKKAQDPYMTEKPVSRDVFKKREPGLSEV